MGCCFGKNRVSDVNPEAITVQPKDIGKSVDDKWNYQFKKFTDDELREQIREWKSLIESLLANEKLTKYARARKRTEFRRVEEVGEYLLRCEAATNDVEKFWLVYVWVTDNIAYDSVGYLSGNYSKCDAQSVMERGLGVCAGYANLFKELSNFLGIDCLRISGYSKGYGYRIGEEKKMTENHAWNAIRSNRVGLVFIDSTWGAGHCTDDMRFVKEFDPYYFATPAHIFNESHFNSTYNATNGRKITTLEDFKQTIKNDLEFHVLELRCLTTDQSMLKAKKNPLVIEYTSPFKLKCTAKLEKDDDSKSNSETKNMTIVQRSDFLEGENCYRYSLIADIPEIGKNYLLSLYGLKQQESLDTNISYPNLTKYLVTRTSDEINNEIPKYNISYKFGLKLSSHHSEYIRFDKNPLVIELSCPKTTKALAEARDIISEKTIEYAVLVQRDLKTSNLIVNVALPNQTALLYLFAKNSSSDDEKEELKQVAKLKLTRGKANNGAIRYCQTYTIAQETTFIFSPIEFDLKANVSYDFKYHVIGALKVMLKDGEGKYYQLEKKEENLWTLLGKSISVKGKLNLFAQFDADSSYKGICYYEVN